MKRNMGSPGHVVLVSGLRRTEGQFRRVASDWYGQFTIGALVACAGLAVIFLVYEIAKS